MARDLETAVFRVIQEALTNVYRHSGSEDARIEIIQDSDRVLIRVRDFGKGIGPAGPTRWSRHQWNEGTTPTTEWRVQNHKSGTGNACVSAIRAVRHRDDGFAGPNGMAHSFPQATPSSLKYVPPFQQCFDGF